MTNSTAPINVTLRFATSEDAVALARLAALDSAHPLTGDVLLAETRGHPVAALSMSDDRVVADPFTASGETVALLRMRGRQLRNREAARPRLGLLRPAAHRAVTA